MKRWWNETAFAGTATPPDGDANLPLYVSGVVLALSLAGLLLLSNTAYPFFEPDEGRYAEIAREMLTSGDFLLPMRQGKAYQDKPPLLFWLTAGSMAAFGHTTAAVRLVPACAALWTLGVVYWAGQRMVGRRAALLGMAALLFSTGFILSGRFLSFDALLTAATTTALLCGAVAIDQARHQTRWWLASAAACGIGGLTKGPIALVIVVPPLLLHEWLRGRGTLRARTGRWLLYFGIVLGVAAPWFVAASIYRPEFAEYFFWRHHVARFVVGIAHVQPFWFYVPILIGAMYPTSLLVGAVAVFLTSRSLEIRRLRTHAFGFLMLAGLWIFGFFSASQSKLPAYVLPSVPLFALAAGVVCDRTLINEVSTRYFRGIRLTLPKLWCVSLALVLAGLLVADWMVVSHEAEGTAAEVLGSLAVCGLLITAARNFSQPLVCTTSLGAATVVISLLGLVDFAPEMARKRSVALQVRQLVSDPQQAGLTIACLGRAQDAVAFDQLEHRPVLELPIADIHAFVDLLAERHRLLVLVKDADSPRWRERLPANVQLEQLDEKSQIYLATFAEASVVRHPIGSGLQ
ncbi:MAG: glycosyltransferase family 39 protein [Pirellulales bacterium]|nr:glycosyltransferase family 39 protein [Pirellulales bacterium]